MKGREIRLVKTRHALTCLPALDTFSRYLCDFSLPAALPHCSGIFLFVNYPPITLAPKYSERRGSDPKSIAVVMN